MTKPLSGLVGQCKLRDNAVPTRLRPMGIPRLGRLPYFGLVMELGTTTKFQTGSEVDIVLPPPERRGFDELDKELRNAQEKLRVPKRDGAISAIIKQQDAEVEERQRALDACNAYVVSIRGGFTRCLLH